MYYRSKPTEIMAWQYTVGAGSEVTSAYPQWLLRAIADNTISFRDDNTGGTIKHERHGILEFSDTDYIIFNGEDDIYACRDDKFRERYEPFTPHTTPADTTFDAVPMSFGDALGLLRRGYFVRRAGWNGKGMFLVYVPGQSSVTIRRDTPYANALGDDAIVDIHPHIDMYTANGNMQPGWLASQTDMLANDWQVV